jgi:AraC-like DNA-binding protein
VLISYISNTGGNPEYNIRSLSFPISGVLFIGPALYFYVKSLTQSDFRFTLRDSLHFLPGVIFILINASIFFEVVTPDTRVHSTFVNLFTTLSSIENFAAIALSFYYIFISIHLMRRHEVWVYEHFSTTSRKSLYWLRNLIISLSLIWIVWLFAVVINFFTRDFILTYLSSYPFQIATSIIIFWIGYVGFIQGEIFSLEISFEKKIDHLKIINKKEVPTNSEVRNALLKAMGTDRLYLIPELTLALLSHQLNLSPKSISQTLNNDLKKNFHDFVNEYRVEEVKRRLLSNDYENLTLLAIAQDSGFNSKSSFNRIFMKATGMSPKKFKDKNGKVQN